MNLSSLQLLRTPSDDTPRRMTTAIRTSGRQVLLLDDSTVVLNVMSAILRRIPGVLLTIESSPTRALEILKRDPGNFDLVLTDIRMPVMNGIEFAARAKALHPRLPILAVTSSPVLVARRAEFAGVVPKPFSPEELVRSVARFVHQHPTSSNPPESSSLRSLGTQHQHPL